MSGFASVKSRPILPSLRRLDVEFAPEMRECFDVLWTRCQRRLTAAPAETDIFDSAEIDIHSRSAQSIVITGWAEGEGTSTVALGLASRAAAVGAQNVCLVDADLLNPGLTEAAGLSNRPGLRDLMAGTAKLEDAAVRVGDATLWLLGGGRKSRSGPLPPDAVIQQTIAMLEEKYRYVIIDAACLKNGAAAYRWGRFIMNTVLIVQAGRTRRQVAAHAAACIHQHGMELLGVVLNHRVDPIPAWLYPYL